jgi:hypothetical protein
MRRYGRLALGLTVLLVLILVAAVSGGTGDDFRFFAELKPKRLSAKGAVHEFEVDRPIQEVEQFFDRHLLPSGKWESDRYSYHHQGWRNWIQVLLGDVGLDNTYVSLTPLAPRKTGVLILDHRHAVIFPAP